MISVRYRGFRSVTSLPCCLGLLSSLVWCIMPMRDSLLVMIMHQVEALNTFIRQLHARISSECEAPLNALQVASENLITDEEAFEEGVLVAIHAMNVAIQNLTRRLSRTSEVLREMRVTYVTDQYVDSQDAQLERQIIELSRRISQLEEGIAPSTALPLLDPNQQSVID